MAGKAKFKKTYGTKLKDQTTGIKQLYSLAGSTGSPRASTMSFGVAGGSSTPPATDEYARLKTSGDTMIGAIAYYPKTALIVDGEIDVVQGGIGALDDDYTSYLYVTGQGGSDDDLVTINGVSNAGQLLHLEAIVTTDITLKHDTGNIFIPSESDHTISAGGFATLIYDVAVHANKWVLVSGSDTDTGLLSSVNTWTGINAFASPTSFSVTSPNIYLGDESSDTINITGTASHQGDIDMNTWDIYAVDRLKFSQSEGSGDALASTDTGIESLYTSTLPFGMKIQIPTANSAIFQIVRGSTEMLNISALGLLIGDDMSMSSNKITNLATPTSSTDGANKSYVDSAGSGANTALSNLSSVSVNATIDMNTNDISNVGTLEVDGTTNLDSTVNLGNGASDDLNVKGKLDFINNYTTQFYASHPAVTGFITVNTPDGSKNLWFS